MNTGISQQFDARLIALFLKTRKALGRKDHDSAVRIAHHGGPADAAALVQLRDVPEFIGVISRIRYDERGTPYTAKAPDWLHEFCPARNEEPELA